MKILKEQTLYKCDYCDKRLLTKHVAKMHEEEFCRVSPIRKQLRKERIMGCDHDWEDTYRTMPGEPHLLEPDSQICTKCQVEMTEWWSIEKELIKQ